MTIGFLVLHYNSYEITKRCINSIKNVSENVQHVVHILVVDNGSNNDSGKRLKDDYTKDKTVDVLILDKAYGFSRGNNLGYKFLCERFNDDFIVVSNNDIIFEQENFIEKIIELYNIYNYALLGPDMIDVQSGAHLNPTRLPMNVEETKKSITILEKKKNSFLVKEDLIGLFQSLPFYPWYVRTIRSKRASIKLQNSIACNTSLNHNIQGGCIVLSSIFIKENDNIFYPETTFYMEEPILYLRCKKYGWKILYSPDIKVLHEQGASFKAKTRNIRKRNRRNFTYSIEATKIYLDLLNKYNE